MCAVRCVRNPRGGVRRSVLRLHDIRAALNFARFHVVLQECGHLDGFLNVPSHPCRTFPIKIRPIVAPIDPLVQPLLSSYIMLTHHAIAPRPRWSLS
jgi:hypothetical protein